MNRQISKKEKNITTSNFLPKVSLFGQAGLQDNKAQTDDDFYNYGVKVTIPIDYNMNKNRQISKIDYLLKQTQYRLKEEEQTTYFKMLSHEISAIEQKMINSKNSIEKYQHIHQLTSDLVKGLLKTKQDLITIENRLHSSRLDLKILNLDKQIALYKLKAHLKN